LLQNEEAGTGKKNQLRTKKWTKKKGEGGESAEEKNSKGKKTMRLIGGITKKKKRGAG